MLEQTNFSPSRQKSEGFFGDKKQSTANTKELAAFRRNKIKKVYDKCNAEYSFFKWEISLVHYKRGYSGPGQLGEFVVALLKWILGIPSFLIIYYIMCKVCTWVSIWGNYLISKHMFYKKYFTFYKPASFMLGFPTYN